MCDDFIHSLKRDHAVSSTRVVGAKFRALNQLLLERFFAGVKRATGNWVYKGYRWHAFSFGYQQAVTGEKAFARFQAQEVQPFYLYYEIKDELFLCTGISWPDIRSYSEDIYVFPSDMEWLFVTTHEMSMGLGPYFVSEESGNPKSRLLEDT